MKAMTPIKILIVDDEKLIRWSLAQKCKEVGHLSLEAENGNEALRVARSESPDVILLEIGRASCRGRV